MSIDQAEKSADALTVADYQAKFDEISAIRQAAKHDWSMSNEQKRQIAREFSAAREDLRAAAQSSSTAPERG